MTRGIRCVLLALGAAWAAGAVEVTLQAPLTTLVPLTRTTVSGAQEITAIVTVPADAPADLGVGAYLTDRDGRWFQRLAPLPLHPGSQRVRVALGNDAPVSGPTASWDPASAATASRAGLFFWSASASRVALTVEQLASTALSDGSAPHRLSEFASDAPTVATGARWSLRLRPQPYPAQPYDPAVFSLTLVVTTPDGREERINGFHEQPMHGADRGDTEEVIAAGRAHFTVRYRPRIPGVHYLRLEAAWADGTVVRNELPALTATGAASDPFVHVDRGDPRFFSVAEKFWWPIGPNLRSVTDPRSGENLGTPPTPPRGTLAYDAYFARLSAAGVDAVEIWLSAWNLALEWRGDWPGYHGLGRYHEGHAWQLDQILDAAWARGIRVNLTVNNHGQGSGWVDSEWRNSPFNRNAGGPLSSPEELLTTSLARERQDQVRRYLVARYGDHPAILAWKLWSELDFVGEQRHRYEVEPLLAQWHEQAAARWRALDLYGHPVTTHWSSNWTRVHPTVAALPGVEFLCFNLYHDPPEKPEGVILAELVQQSTAARALGHYGKPLLSTEYGGQYNACPGAQLVAEHASGAFCGLVCGLAGAPMLWWYEWVDQNERFAPYGAIRRFTAGEDLRDPKGGSVGFDTGEPRVWARAWARPGHILGYLLDLDWQAHGTVSPPHPATQVTIGAQIPAGAMTLAWWDADAGRELSRQPLTHPGGALVLTAPAWRRHLAFKLLRN